MNAADAHLISQHLIDPVICIRCNTCEATCPVGAITHDDRNYVVDAEKCNSCMACISPCPTGSIDNWRTVAKMKTYSIAEQLTWDDLPEPLAADALAENGEGTSIPAAQILANNALNAPSGALDFSSAALAAGAANAYATAQYGATVAPWSAAHPYTHLYGAKAAAPFIAATVTGNVRVTDAGTDYDTHHIVIDFGTMPFPVLEGQSIGVIPPGTDANGRPHNPRQYSIASPRNGERPGYNNASLTIKRVLADPTGKSMRGVASNYMCDLSVGDQLKVVGPFGASFLMANHPKSHLVMICTGTGSAPMRAMTEWRRRLRNSGKFEGGKLMLFFGARTKEELPYFGPLQSLPKDFIDINFVYSRATGQPKKYVQDAMRERAADLAKLLVDKDAHFYVCGLKAMEEGVIYALRDIAQSAGLDWPAICARLKQEGRMQLETY